MNCLVRFIVWAFDFGFGFDCGCLRIGFGCVWLFWRDEVVDVEVEESDVPGRVLKLSLNDLDFFESAVFAIVGGGGKKIGGSVVFGPAIALMIRYLVIRLFFWLCFVWKNQV